ncbi:MAG: protein-tyrosine-phosphatase [Nitratireductor sp.]|jgi:protein-tyrosine-phosphatase|nr:protein-tyrosine-phosphatase [Nitratireductor sp.]
MAESARPASVLYVCALNSIRSPMAENLTRALYGSAVYARSAGVNAGDPDPFAAAVMAERGVPMLDHHPVTLDELGETYFDLVVTLSPEAHHRALELLRSQAVDVEYWPTMDPSTVAGNREQVLDAYRQTRDRLEERIRRRFG